MKDYNHVLSDFTEELRRATNVDEGFAALDKAVDKLGFSGVLYTLIPRIRQDKYPPVFNASDSYRPFLDVYVEARLDLDDPILFQAAAGETKPLDWLTELKRNEMTKKEKEVILIARDDHQITNGITFPLVQEKAYFAVSSITGSNGNRDFYTLFTDRDDIVKECIRLFHGEVMNRWYRSTLFYKPLQDALNPTEKKLLKGYLDHKSLKTMSEEMGLKQGYLKNVTWDIRKKLSGTDAKGRPKWTKEQLLCFLSALKIEL
ncbi:MAG: autoinducer binding domain-containing protein [Candidatus Sedimenticola sp. (ex Thyasira tokunagai)]